MKQIIKMINMPRPEKQYIKILNDAVENVTLKMPQKEHTSIFKTTEIACLLISMERKRIGITIFQPKVDLQGLQIYAENDEYVSQFENNKHHFKTYVKKGTYKIKFY